MGRRLHGRRGPRGLPGCVAAQLDDPDGGPLEQGAERRRGHDMREPRVLHHVPEPLRWKRRVEGDVGAAAAQDRQHGHDHVDRAWQTDADERAGEDARLRQRRGEGLDSGEHLRVPELLAGAHQGELRVAGCAVAGDQGIEILRQECRLGRAPRVADQRLALILDQQG